MDATTTQHGVTADDRAQLGSLWRELERDAEREAEALLLSALLLGGELPEDLAVEVHDFRDDRHRRVLVAMRVLAAAGQQITPAALVAALDAGGALEGAGWAVFVEHLARLESTAVAARWHARTVRRLGRRRLLKRLLRRVLDDLDGPEDLRAMAQLLAELSMSAGGR